MKDWTDRVNNSPQYNVAAALEVGMLTPDVSFLSGMTKEKRTEILNDPSWELIGATGMAIKRLDGIDATFHSFYDKGQIRGWCISINDRALMTGGHGPILRSNCMTLFAGRNKKMSEYMISLGDMADRKDPYKGMISIEVVFQDDVPFYKNIVFGASYQVLHSYRILFKTERCDGDYYDFPDGMCASLRTWGWPYTVEKNATVYDLLPPGMVPESTFDGESHIVYAYGARIRDAWKSLYYLLDGSEKYGVCYRIDGDKKPRQIYHELKQRNII